jgi:hypothetical protein
MYIAEYSFSDLFYRNRFGFISRKSLYQLHYLVKDNNGNIKKMNWSEIVEVSKSTSYINKERVIDLKVLAIYQGYFQVLREIEIFYNYPIICKVINFLFLFFTLYRKNYFFSDINFTFKNGQLFTPIQYLNAIRIFKVGPIYKEDESVLNVIDELRILELSKILKFLNDRSFNNYEDNYEKYNIDKKKLNSDFSDFFTKFANSIIKLQDLFTKMATINKLVDRDWDHINRSLYFDAMYAVYNKKCQGSKLIRGTDTSYIVQKYTTKSFYKNWFLRS